MNGTLTEVPGLRVGHAHDLDAITGCTVILCPPGTVGGVDQRGGAPGTRETDLLHPMHLVQHVDAILLSGGSAFGLAAADGVMRFLAEKGIGYDAGVARVPIVPAAILFDLAIGQTDRHPDAAMGYAACGTASDAPVPQGSIGAGAGATVGKMMGMPLATKGGIGSASLDLGADLIVSALVAVNTFGDVVGGDGTILAGMRDAPDGANFPGTLNILRRMRGGQAASPSNTVIGVVATNAQLDKEGTNKIAQMAQDGLAQAIRPAHTLYDGDTVFALATGQLKGDPLMVNLVGAFAAEVMARAIRNAIHAATSLGGIPARRDLFPVK